MRKAARAVLLAGTLALHLQAQAEEKALNIYNWSEYIGPEALKAFQVETGIQIKYDVFDSPDGESIKPGDAWNLVSYVLSLRAEPRRGMGEQAQ